MNDGSVARRVWSMASSRRRGTRVALLATLLAAGLAAPLRAHTLTLQALLSLPLERLLSVHVCRPANAGSVRSFAGHACAQDDGGSHGH